VRLFEPSNATAEADADADPEAAPSGPLRRVMMLVAYDGSGFHGFAPQPGHRTIGGSLIETLSLISGRPVALTCAGRTDAGVHALGQVVHADLDEVFVAGVISDADEVSRLARSLTRQLGPHIAVLDARVAAEGFDARFSAVARRYRFDILTGSWPDPLLRGRAWHVPGRRDVSAMRLAADALLGTHDFAAFCRRPEGEEGPLERRVVETSLKSGMGDSGRVLRFEIEANAFCHRMVRSVVGTLVSVGEGRLTAADVVAILRSGDRARGSRTAPADGLVLELVRYPPELLPGSPRDGVWRPPA
jgi:tRNA pseudouridine38-40 synthase